MISKKSKKDQESINENEHTSLKGHYIQTIGRRKTAIAQIRLFKKGEGLFLINDKKITDYFNANQINLIKQPLKLVEHIKDINISVSINGGGKESQAEAIRHGLSRALLKLDENNKILIKSKGWLTRDARKKERKKPGLKKARKAPQWSKR